MGVAVQIGRCDAGNNWQINENLIKELILSSELRERILSKSRNLIDFKGSERIINAINAIA